MPLQRLDRGLVVLAALLLGAAVVRTAWVGDDAYIMLRTVDNWYAGHGLRWNVADRVQTYTCPLWMLVCAGGRGLTGEYYFTVLALGGLLTTAALALLLRAAGAGAATATALLLAAVSSRAFVDYSTSGLENPLSHALAAAFVLAWFRGGAGLPRLRRLAVLGALLACTRMDLALLALPPLLAAARTVPARRAAPALLAGSTPFLLWLAFALFYYGTPFPSTAYAKALATGLPAGELLVQGSRYFADLALRDPATAVLLLLAIASACTRRGRNGLPLLLGVLLYLAYVLKVGGDFMAGRFFTTPFVVALGTLAVFTRDWPRRHLVAAGCLALAVACSVGLPAAIAGTGPPEQEQTRWNIHDVRQLGYHQCGLCSPTRAVAVPGELTQLLRSQGIDTPQFMVHGMVGELGFRTGPLFHIVDIWLCDPVLSRLPAYARENWIIGHFGRRVPEGYLEFLHSGDGSRCNPDFLRFCTAVTAVTRGELWSWQRLRAAWDLLRGAHDAARDRFVRTDYFAPPRLEVAAAELDRDVVPDRPNTYWFRAGGRVLYAGGLDVVFDAPQHGEALELWLESELVYHLQWRLGDRVLAETRLPTDAHLYAGLLRYTVPIPAAAQGFTTLSLTHEHRFDHVAAIAALRVLR